VTHATLLDGLKLDGAPRSEVIAPSLLRYDLGPGLIDDFLNDLRAPDWMDRLKAKADLEVRKGLPVVDQQLHRKATLVIVDAVCLRPGFPRLDPTKAVEAGMVIRRHDPATDETQLWGTDRTGRPLGWIAPPDGIDARASDYEPDGARRRARLQGVNRALARKTRLTGDADGVSEQVHRLHLIPDDVARRIGRTILFAVLPTTSRAEVPAAAPPPPFSLEDVAERLPNMLRSDRDDALLPGTGGTITRASFRSSGSAAMVELRGALNRLAQEYGAFTGTPETAALRQALAAIPLEGSDHATLFDWLAAAQAILVENRDPDQGAVPFTEVAPGPGSIDRPDSWPSLTGAQVAAIRDGAHAAMVARWSRLTPSVTRFGPIGEQYHVRCFARVDDHPGCPPRILWSPLSTRYTIRPWFENAGAPPTEVQLPSLADLSNIRPDVAINVPPEIQPFMDKLNLEALMDGEAPKGGLSFGMICGFSIPIITICAFIILQIFLALLNIIFFWLPFVRICIPYPKPSEPDA
jgi:hypothetical protein